MADWNDINGSSSALGEGSFKRRDELRRAEALQRNKVKMGERLDRNIARAVHKGDSRSAEGFISAKKAITGQGYEGRSGIASGDDREQRVADGTLKGSKIRYDMGNIGATNNGMIAEAPPADSATPKNREGSMASPASPVVDEYGNTVMPNSSQQPGISPAQAQGAPATPPVAPSSQTATDAQKQRQAFAKDLDRSTAVQSDPAARERAYAKGESIGVSRDLVDKRMGWEKPVAAQDFSVKPADGQQFQKVDDTPVVSEFDSLTKPDGRAEMGKLSNRMQDSLDLSKKASDAYAKSEKDRITKKIMGMTAADKKLRAELESADQSDAAQKRMTKDYFADVENTEYSNKVYTDALSSPNPMRSAPAAIFGGLKQLPDQPAPINRDTFDPANPPKYQRKVTPRAAKAKQELDAALRSYASAASSSFPT